MRRLVVAAVLLAGAGTAAYGQTSRIGAWDWDAWRKGGDANRPGGLGDEDGDIFSDAAVQQAIAKGCEYLWSVRSGDGGWPAHGGQNQYPTGTTAAAAYALLAAGVSPVDKRMAQTLELLVNTDTNKTYDLGLRCNAWYLANKETGNKYNEAFKKDLRKLIESTEKGAYNYECNSDKRSDGDNSNSQYGVLGAWAGAMAHQEIPEQYWYVILDHWKRAQRSDGGWSYREGQSTATMTAGGIASLYVCFDNLYAERFLKCDVSNRNDKPIRDGLKWLDEHFEAALGGGGQGGGLMGYGDLFYFLYGVERVGLASGFKYFGKQDWYKMGARRLIQLQNGNGSWNGKYEPHVDTAFAVLFLVRGQHPLAVNKLEHDGDWNNRPRDAPGLTRWMSDTLERQLNWQIVSLKASPEEWHDAHILYISGAQDPNFSDEQIGKLRDYVWQGGTIMSVTECNGSPFSQGIRKAYERMFPDQKLQRVPREHPLYRAHYNLAARPAYWEVHNGLRPLAVHTDVDLSKSWQLEMRRTSAEDFQAPSNVLMYVTDKGQIRHRGASHWPRKPKVEPERKIKIARLKHGGGWDPEPLAYERFGRLMARRHGIGIETAAVEIERLGESDAKVATLTGTGACTLSPAEQAALKKFVTSGGTLIIDAAGGSKALGESMEVLLYGMFGRGAVLRLAAQAPVFALGDLKMSPVEYRRKAKVDRGLSKVPNLRGVDLKGRLAVFFSKEDITGGLVGCPMLECAGYEPNTCFELMRNMVIYGSGGVPRKAASPAAGTPGAN